jgi:hypothetical protein
METKKNLFFTGSSEELDESSPGESQIDLNQVVAESLAENELVQSAKQNAFLRERFFEAEGKVSSAERIARSSQEQAGILQTQLGEISSERDSLAKENASLKSAMARLALNNQAIQLDPNGFSDPDVLRSLGYDDPLRAIVEGKLTSQAPKKEAPAFKGAPHVMYRSQMGDGMLRASLKISSDEDLQQRISEGRIILLD